MVKNGAHNFRLILRVVYCTLWKSQFRNHGWPTTLYGTSKDTSTVGGTTGEREGVLGISDGPH